MLAELKLRTENFNAANFYLNGTAIKKITFFAASLTDSINLELTCSHLRKKKKKFEYIFKHYFSDCWWFWRILQRGTWLPVTVQS